MVLWGSYAVTTAADAVGAPGGLAAMHVSSETLRQPPPHLPARELGWAFDLYASPHNAPAAGVAAQMVNELRAASRNAARLCMPCWRRASQDAKRPKRGSVGPTDHGSLMAAASAIHEAAEKKKAAAARKKDKTELASDNYLRKAIAEYSTCVEADPACAIAWFNRGVAYSRVNKERQAIEDFTKVVDLGPRAGVPREFSLGGGHAARDVRAARQV